MNVCDYCEDHVEVLKHYQGAGHYGSGVWNVDICPTCYKRVSVLELEKQYRKKQKQQTKGTEMDMQNLCDVKRAAELMAKVANGTVQVVEYKTKRKPEDGWHRCAGRPLWDWENHDYRAEVKPRVWFICCDKTTGQKLPNSELLVEGMYTETNPPADPFNLENCEWVCVKEVRRGC